MRKPRNVTVVDPHHINFTVGLRIENGNQRSLVVETTASRSKHEPFAVRRELWMRVTTFTVCNATKFTGLAAFGYVDNVDF